MVEDGALRRTLPRLRQNRAVFLPSSHIKVSCKERRCAVLGNNQAGEVIVTIVGIVLCKEEQ